jgi:hypothetical protein
MDPFMEKRRNAECKNFSKGIEPATNNRRISTEPLNPGNVYELS